MHLIPQSWAHLHILVSVFPSVGLVFVLGLFIAAFITNHEFTKLTCLVLFGILGLLAIPTYLSGDGAMASAGPRTPRISPALVAIHRNWAFGARRPGGPLRASPEPAVRGRLWRLSTA